MPIGYLWFAYQFYREENTIYPDTPKTRETEDVKIRRETIFFFFFFLPVKLFPVN